MAARRRLEKHAALARRVYGFPHVFNPALYPPAWLRLPHDEDRDVIPALLAALRALGCQVEHVDAGAKTLRGRAFGAIRRAGGNPAYVMRGTTGAAPKGTPDILGCAKDGRAVAIEAKRPVLLDAQGRVIESAGKPTDAQLDWLDGVWTRGGIAGVAWGPWDAQRIVAASRDRSGDSM